MMQSAALLAVRLAIAGVIAWCAAAAGAQNNPPSYSGQVCFSGSTATVSVTASPEATAILIYPTPPGGGYFMTNDGSGTYTASFSNLAPGTQFTFHLVIQIPQQYEFQPHTVTLAAGCTDFSFGQSNDGGDDPGNGDNGNGNDNGDNGIDPGDFGQGGLAHPRNFRHDVSETDGRWSVLLETGPPASPLPSVTDAQLRYRIADGPMRSAPMNNLGGFIWGALLPESVASGNEISYSFVKTVGIEPVDTAWFARTIGEPAPPIPAQAIETEAALRFRDRHENEWRFDHYPQGYDVGRTFDLVITDDGRRLDFILMTDPAVPVGAVDIKWYNQSGDVGFCDRNISAISQRMAGGNGYFTSTIDNLVHGQRVDVEFTLLAAQTYYSEFIYYYVGEGKLQRETRHPLAFAAGDASIPVVTVKQFAFNQHALNLPPTELGEFMAGKTIFETRWDDGLLFNPPTAFDCNGSPVGFDMGQSPDFVPGLLGPIYTNNSCIECHMLDGRGTAPASLGDPFDDYVVRLSVPDPSGYGSVPHPLYGVQLDTNAVPGATPEGAAALEWEYIDGAFDDGTPYQLRKPIVRFTDLLYGDIGTNIPGTAAPNPLGLSYAGEAEVSVRIAPMIIGLGLLEAVADEEILAWADESDANGDGVSGRANTVPDHESGADALGRFGWKAAEPNLRQQAESAFTHDMGMTAGTAYGAAHNAGVVEVSDEAIDSMVAYLRGLAVPPRDNYRDPVALEGKEIFNAAGCAACHRPTMRTADDASFAPYRGLTIQPFTDLLLHDMGEGLADNRPEHDATGSEWRTPPLWGVGYVGHVLGTPTSANDPNGNPAQPNYLHDGRARSLMEAILWHGGEAQAARDAVLALSASEREALIRYTEFPFVDPDEASTPPQPAICTGDVNGDGTVTPADFTAWVLAFNTNTPDCDQNGDSLCTPADFSAFILNYNAGC
ncbi:MAG: di-heme oxidoredictase family protein [Planctomycetota bacterium]